MKKKVLTVALVLALIAIMVTGSLAYFTAEDAATNTFTIGSVKIEIYENGKATSDAALPFGPMMPIVDVDKPSEDAGYQKKEVKVKNTGASDAYIRTHIAVPTELLDYLVLDISETGWTKLTSTEGSYDGVAYTVYTYDYNTAVKSDDLTVELLKGVYLGSNVDLVENNDGDLVFALRENGQIVKTSNFVAHDYIAGDEIFTSNSFNILVASQAIQAQGFDTTVPNPATAALNAGFGEGTNPWK